MEEMAEAMEEVLSTTSAEQVTVLCLQLVGKAVWVRLGVGGDAITNLNRKFKQLLHCYYN